ncbi:MAG: spheroidene monooxygenase [Pseudomonadota bacterium]
MTTNLAPKSTLAISFQEGVIHVTSLSLFRFAGIGARAWAFAQMGLARPAFARLPGVGFWQLCGTGTGEGFTPLPNTGVYTALATWPSLEAARETIETARIYRRYRAWAAESWTLYMTTLSARGVWHGAQPFEVAPPGPGPLAVLTRATLKPSKIARFWRRVPDISARIGSDPAVQFKIGMGERPLSNQITFSIWPDAPSMAAFARRGPHAEAIRAVRDEGWFAEELYARFRIVDQTGTWDGKSPLQGP